MKKKISRILGVVLTLALLSSLAIVSAPVSAGTQKWGTFAIPAAGATAGRVLDPGNTFTGPFAIDKDGTAIYAASDVAGGGAALVKSQDGGRTWTLLTGFTATIAGTPGAFTDIVCSSIDANTVYVTDGVTIWKTSDGGTTWAALSSLFTSLSLTPGLGEAGFIASLDVGYLGNSPYIFAACSSFGTGAGGAYVCEEAVWGMPWSALLLDTDRPVAWEGADVYDLVVDPDFGATQMVMAAAVSTGPYGEYPLVTSLNGNATWVTQPVVSGSSAELTIPQNYVQGDEAKVQMPLSASGLTLNGINSLSYQYYVDPSTPATAAVYDGFVKIEPWAEPSGGAGVGYSTYGAPYLVIELDADLDGSADTWVVQAKWAASNIGSWQLDNIEATEPFHVPSFGTTTPGFSIGLNWGSLAEIKAAVSSLAPLATLGDARVLAVKVAIGDWNPAGPTPPAATGPVVNYVDEISINGVAYDPEPPMTFVTSKYGGAQWNATVNDVSLPGVASALYSASLWLPDDFNSNLASGLMQAFVGVDSFTATEGDVFLAHFAAQPVAFDLNVSGISVGTCVSGLDGIGPGASAQLLAAGSRAVPSAQLPGINVPRVFRSTPGGFTWLADTKAPTGGQTTFGINRALPSILMLDATTALVGTHGPDCGVSITNDYGATWNTISLINTTITSIDDLELGSFFMTTRGANDAVWRHDGTNWERVFSGSIFSPATTSYLVQQSPAGDAVFVADLGGVNIWRSMDDGQSWTLQVNWITSTGPGTGTISALAVIDANTLVVGDAANLNIVYTTTTNGGFWFSNICTVGTVQTLVRDAGTGDLLAGGTTNIRRSQNNGISWSAVTTPLTATITSTSLAFSINYASDSTIYATGTDANAIAGVWKYDFSAAVPAWTQIDGDGVAPPAVGAGTVANGTGLVAAPAITGVANAEMVYAPDATAGAGVWRIRQPRKTAEQMADANSTFMGLWYEPGSNKLYTIDTATPRIRTYTDTLNVSGTGVGVSAITPTTATISWTALPKATSYYVVVHTTARTNFYTAVGGIMASVTAPATTLNITGLSAGVTYFVSVWVANPVSSYLFDAAATSFTTLPLPPIAAIQLIPIHGAINIPILGPAFAWAPPSGVPGIIGYDWELSEDPTFASFLGQEFLAVPYFVFPGPLDYETDYYWRVRAVTATGVSAWVTSVFTTVAEPEPPVTVEPPPTPTITVDLPQPTVTVIPPDVSVTVVPPDITVDIPQPTTTIIQPVIEMPEEVTPMYIWAIVAIGALLVIAVIILIIRTRRVV